MQVWQCFVQGANLNMRDKNGNTALKWAEIRRNEEAEKILRAAGDCGALKQTNVNCDIIVSQITPEFPRSKWIVRLLLWLNLPEEMAETLHRVLWRCLQLRWCRRAVSSRAYFQTLFNVCNIGTGGQFSLVHSTSLQAYWIGMNMRYEFYVRRLGVLDACI